ncbi:MAG TPA: transglutaminase-like domain-containing protein [Bradyrhizobium sp.]|nr:transglutaminase-like domain-containing protein [Bradyrhizobium sp.]
MPPIDGLIFAGYRSFDAGADDPFRIKWNAVRPSLELPAGAEIPALTMPAISGFNADINQRIIYTPEPDSGDAWQTPAQTLAILHGDCEDYAILKYATLLRAGLSAASLRIVIGEIISIAGNEPHAWCAAHIEGIWHALDNKFPQIIATAEYINWLPLAAMHDASVVRFGREFTINDRIR